MQAVVRGCDHIELVSQVTYRLLAAPLCIHPTLAGVINYLKPFPQLLRKRFRMFRCETTVGKACRCYAFGTKPFHCWIWRWIPSHFPSSHLLRLTLDVLATS